MQDCKGQPEKMRARVPEMGQATSVGLWALWGQRYGGGLPRWVWWRSGESEDMASSTGDEEYRFTGIHTCGPGTAGSWAGGQRGFAQPSHEQPTVSCVGSHSAGGVTDDGRQASALELK